MQRPGQRKRRGRTDLSTQLSGGAVLNWSPLHTRQWADNKCILRFVALFSIPNSGLGSLVRLADGQPGPPSVLTPNSGSRNPALSTCSRILDSATASSRTQSWEDYRSGETQKAVQHCSVSSVEQLSAFRLIDNLPRTVCGLRRSRCQGYDCTLRVRDSLSRNLE